MRISIQADQENDALYLAFDKGALQPRAAAKTVRVSEDIAVDLGRNGELIGVDILNATKVVGDVSNVEIDALVGVKEASALVGVQRSNFVRDYAGRPGFPSPVAELATGRVWLRSQVESYAKSRALRPRKKSIPATV